MNNIRGMTKFLSIVLFFVASTRAAEVPKFLRPEYKNDFKVLKLWFDAVDTETALNRNIIQRAALYVYWFTHAATFLVFINSTPGFTFKNSVLNFMGGMWLGLSINWYKRLKAEYEVLEMKYELYAKMLEDIQSKLDQQQPPNEQSENNNDTQAIAEIAA